MRNLLSHDIDRHRVAYKGAIQIPGQKAHFDPMGGFDTGAFLLPSKLAEGRRGLRVIACGALDDVPGMEWEHVSVTVDTGDTESSKKTTPTWGEMQYVRELFFEAKETVVQLHPPLEQCINIHEGCLHLFRPTKFTFPLPASIMV